MKKKVFLLLLLSVSLVSCSPAGAPALTQWSLTTTIPTSIQPTATVITATPPLSITPLQSTATFTPVQQEWLNSVTEDGPGIWLIRGATFDQNSIRSFEPEYKGGNAPRFGSEGVGEVHLRCYGEVKFTTGSTALIGLEWWVKLTSPEQNEKTGWQGLDHMFILGGAIADGQQIVEPRREHCLEMFETNVFKSQSTITIDLYSFSVGGPQIFAEAAYFEEAWLTLMPPVEFWKTGDVNVLPRLFNKPFLMIYYFKKQE